MEEKSPAAYVVSTVVEHLRAWRWKKTIFRIDGEPAIRTTRTRLRYPPSMKSFRSEGTGQDDDKVTKTGQSLTGQAGEVPRGHAEAHALIRSSKALGGEQSCVGAWAWAPRRQSAPRCAAAPCPVAPRCLPRQGGREPLAGTSSSSESS